MSESTWKKEPAIEGTFGGCLNCGPRPSFFPAEGVIAVGFGFAALTRDGVVVYEEQQVARETDFLTGEAAESMAAADPDHDWRIILDGPLSGRTYQRHEAGQWALIEQNQGFA